MNIDIFKELNMCRENGLATEEVFDYLSSYQRLFYSQVKSKIGVDAVYFLRDAEGVAKIPLVYFSMMDTYNANTAAKLHCLSWNMGEAPLLFIVTPTELKIFSNYKAPRMLNGNLDPDAGLIETINLITDLETQRQQLRRYNRSLLESGEYWRISKERFDICTRIDTTLMSNLKVMRKRLINKLGGRQQNEKTKDVNVISIVHGLLSRSILIKYLEERKDQNGLSVFPKEFYKQFSGEGLEYEQYTDVLNNKESTYKLFDVLEKKFNGDMLPLIEDELDLVREDDLKELRSFLVGDSDLASYQMTLWPLYDFNVIPIQTISSIYELFFHLSDAEDDDKGTYYTPLHLVDTLLDEVYPWEGEYKPISIIDPSCGSGIFLVEAYRRIVCRWMQTNKTQKISSDQLTRLLMDSIFGVDKNEEAVRIASFSLSLALCDFLDPRSIWDDLYLPKLVNTNLTVSDFFDDERIFNQCKYDIVIGNPPWQSQLTDRAISYLTKINKIVGDKQIAQAFSIKCTDICKDNGIICLLMPSKGFLFNRSSKNSRYRKDFFENYTVSVIINFSLYRKFLFDHASGPAAGVIYHPYKPSDDQVIFYCTPKPQFTVQDNKKFSIEPNDISKLPLDVIHDDRVWKIAMWGTPRDLELIDKMQSTYSTLAKFIAKYKMCSAEGFKRGNRTKSCDDFVGLPNIDANIFRPYYMAKEEQDLINFTDFECIVSQKRDIFKAPHLIIKQSHKKARFMASVLDYDAAFNHSLLGIHGDVTSLKYLCLIINSKVYSYYHMMTNRKWLIERDELEAGDIWATPIPLPSDQMLVDATMLFDGLVAGKYNEQEKEEFVNKVFGLQHYETELINDAVNNIYDYFSKKGKSLVFNAPTNNIYDLYYKSLVDVLHNTLGRQVIHKAKLFVSKAPLTVLALYLEGDISCELNRNSDDVDSQEILEKLDSMLTEEQNYIFIRRNVRIYTIDTIFIIKPKQNKYWNYSSACRDADDIFSDIMKVWR